MHIKSHSPSSTLNTQQGAYAIEFVFVFIVMCLIIYGLLTFGMAFAAQQSINLASQEGARSLTRFQSQDAPTDQCRWDSTTTTTAPTTEQRAQRAVACVMEQAAWIEDLAQRMNNHQNTVLHVAVCQPSGLIYKRGEGECTGIPLKTGEYEITLRYDYSQNPLVPNFGFIDLYTTVRSPITLQNQQRIRTSGGLAGTSGASL